MELKRSLLILWNWWWLVLVAAITVIVSTIVFTYTRIPQYETTVRLVVSPSALTLTSLSELRATTTALDKPIVANTYAEIGQSPTIINAAWAQLGLNRQKDYAVSSSVLPETSIIVLTVSGPDPALVQQLATAITEQTLIQVTKLYEVYDLILLDPAVLPTRPVIPNTPLNFGVGAVLALVFGIIAAFLAEYLKTPVEPIEQLSIINPKTGAYKASYLLRRMQGEMSRSQRVRRPFVVGVVRLENFEEVSAGFSSETRQLILKQVIQVIKQVLPEENLVGQWHGDTLALLMPDITLQEARQILEEIQTRLNWTNFEAGDTGFELNITTSYGLAAYDLNGVNPEGLVRQAEEALHHSRN